MRALTPPPVRGLLVLAVTLTASSPAFGVTVGETFDASIGCDGTTVVKTVPPGNTSFIVPSDGVLTSWSTSAESGGNRMAAVVYRQVGGDYTLVGASDRVVPVGPGVKTYPTNIAVTQGDLLGSWVETRNGGLSVQKTCANGAGAGQSTTWWYDDPPNVFPPTSVVPISGANDDTGWRYNISAELGPSVPDPDPVPDPAPSPGAPTAPAATSPTEAPTIAPKTLPGSLLGRWTRPSRTGVVRVWGTVPAGTTRVIQTARTPRPPRARATQRFLPMAMSTARTGTCTIAGTTYRCGIRLTPGRWTITTSATGPAGVLARSTRQVVARSVSLLPVTG